MYNIIVLPKFYTQLEKHLEFLDRVSTTASIKLEDTILNSIENIKNFPEACPILINNIRKFIIEKRYVITFEIIENNIVIQTIYDGRSEEYANLLIN